MANIPYQDAANLAERGFRKLSLARQQRRGSGDVWAPSPLAQRRKSQVPGSWGRYLLPLPAQPTPSWHP